MKIGVIGLSGTGRSAAGELLNKTVGELWAYDPDGAKLEGAQNCACAAELLERCDAVILSLKTAGELIALFNGIHPFLREGQILIDLTQVSPGLAHKTANTLRRCGVRYLDCGIFGAHGLTPPFLFFVGGEGEAFSRVQPVIRCFAPGCRYMGPAGRGQAVRLICRSLAARIQEQVEKTAELAARFGIDEGYFLDSLGDFEEIADPLARLGGGASAFSSGELHRDREVAAEMARRAGIHFED